MTEPVPEKYRRTFSFAAHSAASPDTPHSGTNVDQEFDAIGQAIADLVDFVRQTIDDDGRVQASRLALGSLMGSQGATGPQGPQGPQGVQGPQGNQGSTGPQGPEGPQGQSYQPNATGVLADRTVHDGEAVAFSYLSTDTGEIYFKLSATNADWSAGFPFGRGPDGAQGVQGIDGPEGAQGIQGPAGTDGTNGTSVHYVTADPTTTPPATVQVNDLIHYQAPTDHLLYVCTQITPTIVIELKGSLRGPQGDEGPQGPIGPQGATGAQGDQGDTGATGATGQTGPQGPQGDPGPAGLTPPGTITYFPGQTIPAGFVKANGAALSRVTYADLFAVLGTDYGVGDGVTTFNVPDLRGEFIRGHDDGRGVDAGRALGSVQTDEFKEHLHVADPPSTQSTTAGNHQHNGGTTHIFDAHDGPYGWQNAGNVWHPVARYTSGIAGARRSNTNWTGDHTHWTDIPAFDTELTGGAETRPRNIALTPIIKF